jgi:glycosyltransferase involved in cell wall biosynthesis
VVYAIKPRLPSLGLALLANFHFARPVVLEINDLESVVANPRTGTVVPDAGAVDVRPDDRRLLDPHGQLWSVALEEIARDLPVLVTHNVNLDRHFGDTSYQLRNIKDEEAYDPDRIDRASVRRRLGLAPDAFVLLFGGMVRRHKGVFSLAHFVEDLDDDRVVLLVVSSRPNPDEKELARAAGDRVRILPPQGRNAMAEINAAADAAVIWLDPNVPASHFQLPFKLTDAMAVGLPVVANPISDLTQLGQQGYLRLVEYDDFEGLARAIEELRADPEETRRMTERARRLFLRQFSYRAARASVELILRRVADDRRCLPAASRFEALFSAFYEGMGRFAEVPR